MANENKGLNRGAYIIGGLAAIAGSVAMYQGVVSHENQDLVSMAVDPVLRILSGILEHEQIGNVVPGIIEGLGIYYLGKGIFGKSNYVENKGEGQ